MGKPGEPEVSTLANKTTHTDRVPPRLPACGQRQSLEESHLQAEMDLGSSCIGTLLVGLTPGQELVRGQVVLMPPDMKEWPGQEDPVLPLHLDPVG